MNEDLKNLLKEDERQGRGLKPVGNTTTTYEILPRIAGSRTEISQFLPRPHDWHGVIGQDHAVRELQSIVDGVDRIQFLRHHGVRPEQGIILYGPARVGKTSLAEGLARALGDDTVVVPIDGAEIFTKWVHGTEEKAMKLFDKAERAAKEGKRVVMIMNEVDRIAANVSFSETNHDQGALDLTKALQIRIEDVFKKNPTIIIVATTNDLKAVDERVKGAGRLGVHIRCDLPQTAKEVEDIFAFSLYHIADQANATGRVPPLRIDDLVRLDSRSIKYMKEDLLPRLQCIPHATIIRGVERAVRRKLDGSQTVLEPLNAEELYSGISDLSAIDAKEELEQYNKVWSRDKGKWGHYLV